MSEERVHGGQRSVIHSIALLMAVAFAWQCCADGIAMVEAIRGHGVPRVAQRAIVERSVRETRGIVRLEREIPARITAQFVRIVCDASAEVKLTRSRDGFAAELRAELMNLPPPRAA